jgi:hypothetical protein
MQPRVKFFSNGLGPPTKQPRVTLRNGDLPICRNCAYLYRRTDEDNPLCTKFKEIDLVTGKITYDFAHECRTNENKCGKVGSEYHQYVRYRPT